MKKAIRKIFGAIGIASLGVTLFGCDMPLTQGEFNSDMQDKVEELQNEVKSVSEQLKDLQNQIQDLDAAHTAELAEKDKQIAELNNKVDATVGKQTYSDYLLRLTQMAVQINGESQCSKQNRENFAITVNNFNADLDVSLKAGIITQEQHQELSNMSNQAHLIYVSKMYELGMDNVLNNNYLKITYDCNGMSDEENYVTKGTGGFDFNANKGFEVVERNDRGDVDALFAVDNGVANYVYLTNGEIQNEYDINQNDTLEYAENIKDSISSNFKSLSEVLTSSTNTSEVKYNDNDSYSIKTSNENDSGYYKVSGTYEYEIQFEDDKVLQVTDTYSNLYYDTEGNIMHTDKGTGTYNFSESSEDKFETTYNQVSEEIQNQINQFKQKTESNESSR